MYKFCTLPECATKNLAGNSNGGYPENVLVTAGHDYLFPEPHIGTHTMENADVHPRLGGEVLQSLAQVGLMGRVWPASRVLVGMRCCKWLNSELSGLVESILLVASETRAIQHEGDFREVIGGMR